jgi:hypothetical protein
MRHGNHCCTVNRIEAFLPRQRGNVSLSNLQVVNAILYVAEQAANGADCRSVFVVGHDLTRMNRWAKAGALDRLFEEVQPALIRVKIEAMSLDSTTTSRGSSGKAVSSDRGISSVTGC